MDRAELRRILAIGMPNCKRPESWLTPLNRAMVKYGIDTDPDFIAAFLAQIAVESSEMNILEENLLYNAERLCKVWPARFPTLESAWPYHRNPAKLANHVYGSRMGNGPFESGDGWLYRGRGLKMVTGKSNYRVIGDEIGLDLVRFPDLLSIPEQAALSAAAFWGNPTERLSQLAQDLPNDNDDHDFLTITKVIQGGSEGLARRRQYWGSFRQALDLKGGPGA